MQRVDGGAEFDLVVVCNGGDERRLVIPDKFAALRAKILSRANSGYNIGAWNYGWEAARGYEYYLFLQDECFIKRAGWVSEFEYRMDQDSGIGLLGEAIMWDRMSWEYIRAATDRDMGTDWFDPIEIHPIDIYRNYIEAHGVERGVVGTHLQSLILFTSDKILNEVGGFLVGKTYHEAVASEIGISRLIESKGYRISKIKDAPFALIGHWQWTTAYSNRMRMRRRILNVLHAFGLMRSHK